MDWNSLRRRRRGAGGSKESHFGERCWIYWILLGFESADPPSSTSSGLFCVWYPELFVIARVLVGKQHSGVARMCHIGEF